ncbi:hypothetical protein BJ508DRAFT_148717 [Ascobolus immersus RN42]|uniref:Uncharacterized protein n=1 Tax=Ascobolus immersus RN42 TaxID=1160509 RepID=A0A3N4ILI2_ASCIM|nr:hypothetical protein BJ508DRAFT_148717 [Ascobolus immersus RN42]
MNGKVGFYGFYHKVGSFRQIRRFLPPPTSSESASTTRRLLPINLIPTNLVNFRILQPGYTMTSEVTGDKGEVWNVRHPSLPGLMDAILFLMENYAKDVTHRDEPYYMLDYLTAEEYEQMGPVALKKEILYFHGKNMWVHVMDISFKKEDRGGRDCLEEVPERIRKVAALLRPSSESYLLQLIVNADPYEDDAEEPDDNFADGSWEEVYGVSHLIRLREEKTLAQSSVAVIKVSGQDKENKKPVTSKIPPRSPTKRVPGSLPRAASKGNLKENVPFSPNKVPRSPSKRASTTLKVGEDDDEGAGLATTMQRRLRF